MVKILEMLCESLSTVVLIVKHKTDFQSKQEINSMQMKPKDSKSIKCIKSDWQYNKIC